METAPDASCGFCGTLDGLALKRLDLGSRRVKKQLNLLLNGGDLQAIKRNNFVAVVGIETANNGFFMVALPDRDLNVWVFACKVLELGEEKSARALR